MAPITVRQALEKILQNTPAGNTGLVSLEDPTLAGSVLAEDVFADRDIPPFHRAAVDGYAFKRDEYEGGRRRYRILGTLRAGSPEVFPWEAGGAIFVMTGAAVPADYDAIIQREDVSLEGNEVIFSREKTPAPGFNIALQGEDARKGDVVLKKGTRIDVSSLPVLAAVGKGEILVQRRPTVSLVSTGDEIVPVGSTPETHQIRDSSSYSLRMLLSYHSIALASRFRVQDREEEVRDALRQALESDLVLVTGGVSMGVTDRIPDILESLGVEKIFHKVQVKPGKPLYFGKTRKGGLVFGLPGNPVSSLVGLKIFVEPAIRRFSGLALEEPMLLPLAVDKKKKHDREEYTQVRIVRKDGQSALEPFQHHGSGDIVHLSGSAGLMLQEANELELKAGTVVPFFPWRVL